MSNLKTTDECKKYLESQLNYGGIFVDGTFTSKPLSVAYEQGDFEDEIKQLEVIGNAFLALASSLSLGENK